MRKFIKTFLICILIGIGVGFINTLFVYEGIWAHFNKGLNTVPFFVHLIYGFIALFLVILAHEMGHFISFKNHGIKPKALYALGLAFVDDHGWKIRFVPKFLFMVGGIVIPEHVSITSNEEENKIVEHFKRVLLAGPKASIIYGITIFLLWAIFLFTHVYWISGLLFTMMIVSTLMTILAILSSRISRSGMYGDFAAKKAFETDKLFRLTYLIQLTTLLKHDEKSMDYFWPQIVHMLETRNQPRNHLYSNLLAQYIYEVAFEGNIACSSIEKNIQRLTKNTPKTEDGLIMYLNSVFYFESMGDKAKVNSLLNQLDTSTFKMDQKVLIYYLRLTNHLLHIKDESEFLENPKNIHSSSLDWVYKPLRLKNELKEIKR